jgi:hypothetical protein
MGEFKMALWRGAVRHFNDGWLKSGLGLCTPGTVVGLCSVEFVHSHAVLENLLPYMHVQRESSILLPLADAWKFPMLVEPYSSKAIEVADLDMDLFAAGNFIDYIQYGESMRIELISRLQQQIHDSPTSPALPASPALPLRQRIVTSEYEYLEMSMVVIVEEADPSKFTLSSTLWR